MAGLNSVHLIGNLGRDPDLRNTQGGTAVANFSLAMNEKWKDAAGKDMERVEWIDVVVWGKQAESCAKYLTKGRSVCVLGRLQTRSWDDDKGIKRWKTEIVASQVLFLGDSGSSSNRPPSPPANDYGQPPPGFRDAPAGGPQADDDIPY